jgi:hypothetical protein
VEEKKENPKKREVKVEEKKEPAKKKAPGKAALKFLKLCRRLKFTGNLVQEI